MTRYVFKMPDLGEGTVQAEIVAWHVKLGEIVQEDQIMAEVMTDKAAVEVPAPVTGRVVNINGQPGDMIRVGAEFDRVRDGVERGRRSKTATAPAAMLGDGPASRRRCRSRRDPASCALVANLAVSRCWQARAGARSPSRPPQSRTTGRVKASPATRRKAREAGIDLRLVQGRVPAAASRRRISKRP